jgi:hypothetical protein
MIPWRVRRMNASVTNQIKPKHSLQSANWNILDIKCTAESAWKSFDIRTDRLQWKIRKTMYKMINRNMRNHDDEIEQNLNCHAKLSAIEGSELKYHEILEMSGNRRVARRSIRC